MKQYIITALALGSLATFGWAQENDVDLDTTNPADTRDTIGTDASPADDAETEVTTDFVKYDGYLDTAAFVGSDVYNMQEEEIGGIDRLLLSTESGEVEYVIVSAGGFLGIGDRLVAVPWSEFEVKERIDRMETKDVGLSDATEAEQSDTVVAQTENTDTDTELNDKDTATLGSDSATEETVADPVVDSNVAEAAPSSDVARADAQAEAADETIGADSGDAEVGVAVDEVEETETDAEAENVEPAPVDTADPESGELTLGNEDSEGAAQIDTQDLTPELRIYLDVSAETLKEAPEFNPENPNGMEPADSTTGFWSTGTDEPAEATAEDETADAENN